MTIITCVNYPDDELEKYRPDIDEANWEIIISGYWSDSPNHSGHIGYYIHKTPSSTWLVNAVERNVCLDDVTEEDVEKGRLNDDQMQAMWGMTLEEARCQTYERIVAIWPDAPSGLSTEEAAVQIYNAIHDADGKVVEEVDSGGLIK